MGMGEMSIGTQPSPGESMFKFWRVGELRDIVEAKESSSSAERYSSMSSFMPRPCREGGARKRGAVVDAEAK